MEFVRFKFGLELVKLSWAFRGNCLRILLQLAWNPGNCVELSSNEGNKMATKVSPKENI